MRKIKVNGNGALFDYKYHSQVGKEIERLFKEGKIDFTFDLEGSKIDVTQDIAVSISVLESNRTAGIRACIIRSSKGDLQPICLTGKENFTILQSSNLTVESITKYTLYGALLAKSSGAFTCISMLVLACIDSLKDPRFNTNIGTDAYSIFSVLQWAKQNGIINIMFSSPIGIQFKGVVNQLTLKEDTKECYLEKLTKLNSRYSEAYYKYKVGDIFDEEYLFRIATLGGELPASRDTRYSTVLDSYIYSLTDYETCDIQEICTNKSDIRIVNDIVQSMSYHLMTLMVLAQPSIIYGGYSILFSDANEKIKKELTDCNNELTDIKNKIREYKLNYTKIKKQLSKVESENKQLQSELTAKDKYIETLKVNVDMHGIKNKAKKLENEVIELKEKLIDTQRSCNKRDNVIGQLRQNEEELKSLLASEKMHNIRAKQIVESTNNCDMPIANYINAIKRKNIVIVGGDILHGELSKLGFKHLHLVKSTNYNTPLSVIRQADLVVLLTGYVAHSTTESIKVVVDSQNVPLMYFNNSNIYKLCKDMFSFIYSDEYIDARKHKKKLIKGM